MPYRTSKETQDRKDAKKLHILNTATEVFARKGYHNTTVKDIVDEAGISVGSFYFYFKSKEELFSVLYDEISGLIRDTVESVIVYEKCGFVRNFARTLTTALWMYQTKRDLARLLLIEAVAINPDFEKKLSLNMRNSNKRMEEWLKYFMESDLISVPDLRLAALSYEGILHYHIIDWLEGDGLKDLTDSAFGIIVYNLNALRTDFEEAEVKKYIAEILEELKAMPIPLIK